MTDAKGDIKLSRDGEVTYLNHGRLGYDRLIRGVYGHLPAPTRDPWNDRRQALVRRAQAVAAAYPDAVLCGVTALQVLGVAMPSELEDWDNCHVIVGPGAYRPVRQGVVAHRSLVSPRAWRVVEGIPVLHPADCWLQLRGASDNNLIEVADGLFRRHAPLLRLDAMNKRLAELAGAPGVKRARRLMRWVRPGTDSIYETRTRLVLVRAGLPCPLVNPEVVCPLAKRRYYLDMAYMAERIGVEYDGGQHVGDTDQMESDADRRRHLQDEGWMVITVTKKRLDNPSEIVRSVESALIVRRAAVAAAW